MFHNLDNSIFEFDLSEIYTNLAFFFVYFGGKSSCLFDHPVCRRMRAVAAINITHGHAMLLLLLLHAGILHPKILSGAMQKFDYIFLCIKLIYELTKSFFSK